MKEYSIKELEHIMETGSLTASMEEMMRHDTRKGVQKLLQRHDRQQAHTEAMEAAFTKMQSHERELRQSGHQYVAGMDEAGRGPLAGPVVAAAVVLPEDFKLLGLDDSKQLSAERRKLFFETITDQAISYGVGIISNDVIDQVNIFEATKLAMYQAIDHLTVDPDYILVDAVALSDAPVPSEAIIKGDQKSISIAAASIVAKEIRDGIMEKAHAHYPEYDFRTNKGYPTKNHMEAIRQFGTTHLHRHSFGPVREMEDHPHSTMDQRPT